MLQEEMSAIVDRNPFAKHIGMKLTEVRLGYAKGTVPMKKNTRMSTEECMEDASFPWQIRLQESRRQPMDTW